MIISIHNSLYILPTADHLKKIFNHIDLKISDSDFYDLNEKLQSEINKIKNSLNFQMYLTTYAINSNDEYNKYTIGIMRYDNLYIITIDSKYIDPSLICNHSLSVILSDKDKVVFIQ